MQTLIKLKKNEDFVKISDFIRNLPEIFERKSRGLSPDSTSLPDVNLVDGLPSARHNGWSGILKIWGSADIYDFCNFERFQVFTCIVVTRSFMLNLNLLY